MINLAAKPILALRRAELTKKTAALKQKVGRAPHLSVVLVGSDPASQVYVGKKETTAKEIGFTSETILFPENATPSEVFAKIKELNANPLVDGILIQRPLPKQFSEKEAIFWVDPKKDVDCLHPENVGLLVTGDPRFLPCTPAGVMIILEHYQIPVSGKVVCVVGRSAIVGKPLAALLLSKNATLIQVHRSTKNPEELCKLADVVFAAAGAPRLINKNWIKPGAAIIDVGIHRGPDGKLFGDVDAESVKEVASALTPVPGGVGPMTIQVLLENTFLALEKCGLGDKELLNISI